mgnify:CR=1 FL=1
MKYIHVTSLLLEGPTMSTKRTLIRRSNGYYYLRDQSFGQDKWVSTRTKNKAEAMAIVIAGLEPKETTRRIDLSSFIPKILDYVSINSAPKTQEVYRLSLNALLAIIGDKPLIRIRAVDVDRFKAQRMSELSPVSVNIQLRTLRSAFNHAVRWEMIPRNPFAGVQMIRIPEKPPAYLSREQFRQLCDCIGDSWIRPIVVFAVYTGMRQGEILHLEWSQVDMARRVVHVTSTATFKTKAGKRRNVPLNQAAMDVLESRPQEHSRVFIYNRKPIRRDSLTLAFKRFVRQAGLPESIHFHSLRHTFASWLVQDGVSLYQVARLLGHANTRTTEIYAHLQPETMHDVVAKLGEGW